MSIDPQLLRDWEDSIHQVMNILDEMMEKLKNEEENNDE